MRGPHEPYQLPQTYLSHLAPGSGLERIHLAFAVEQAAQAAPHLAVGNLGLSVVVELLTSSSAPVSRLLEAMVCVLWHLMPRLVNTDTSYCCTCLLVKKGKAAMEIRKDHDRRLFFHSRNVGRKFHGSSSRSL